MRTGHAGATPKGRVSKSPANFVQTAPALGTGLVTPGNVLQLQRSIGNHAVARLLANRHDDSSVQLSPRIQAKPKNSVDEHGDEQEANAVAQQITHPTQQPVAQRKHAAPSSTLGVDRVGVEGGTVEGDVEASIRAQRGHSSPLPQTIRRTLEPHLGRDLSQVRTHTDASAAHLNKQLGAKAFTYGRDIFYGAGHSPSDIQLTAHEATHFVQQQNPAPTAEESVRRSVDTKGLSTVQPRIQRDKEDVTYGGKTKSIDKDDQDALKSGITELSMQGIKSVSNKSRPEAVMLMGASGSGKSSIINEVVPDRSKFVHADPDAVKEAMPSYQAGLKAGNQNIATTVHAQSKDITKSVVNNAINTRRNLLYDGTGGNRQEYEAMITSLRGVGYRIKLVMTHISVDEGLKRVAERAAITGRAIPDNVVRDMYHWVPRNFPELVNRVDQALLFDNMVPKGQPPKLIWEKGDGTTLNTNQIDNLKALLSSIGGKVIEDAPPDGEEEDPTDQETMDREHFPLDAHRRYLQDGGTSRWMDDAGSTKYGIGTSRKALSQIDTNLKLYRQYKSKKMGNAEAQGNLLLGMKRALATSKYQTNDDKNTKTFIRRKQATSMLTQEVKEEIQSNPQRLLKIASPSDQVKELVKVGFTSDYLGKILKRDLKLLYQAHTGLSHHQTKLAQEAFDELNPIEREEDGAFKYSGPYISRTRDTFHFAQQLLSAHHHQAIGGLYASAFGTPAPMDNARLDKVTNKYVRNQDFLGATTLDKVRKSNNATRTLEELVSDHPNLSSQEIEALRIYTSSKYRQMNATMHDVRMDDPKQQTGFKGYSSISQLASSGLSKLPSYQGSYTYRGDSNFGGLVNTARAGTVFKTPSFMSTSKQAGIGNAFGTNVGWLVKLASKSRGKDLEHISVAALEYEVLFPPGTKMKVVDVYHRSGSANGPENETPQQKMKRRWKSERGKPLTKEAYDFAAMFNETRNTLIVLQEVG